jgi:hypothetical protein
MKYKAHLTFSRREHFQYNHTYCTSMELLSNEEVLEAINSLMNKSDIAIKPIVIPAG